MPSRVGNPARPQQQPPVWGVSSARVPRWRCLLLIDRGNEREQRLRAGASRGAALPNPAGLPLRRAGATPGRPRVCLCHRCPRCQPQPNPERAAPSAHQEITKWNQIALLRFPSGCSKAITINQPGLRDSPCVSGLSQFRASKCEVPAEQEAGNSSGSRMCPHPASATGSREMAEQC